MLVLFWIKQACFMNHMMQLEQFWQKWPISLVQILDVTWHSKIMMIGYNTASIIPHFYISNIFRIHAERASDTFTEPSWYITSLFPQQRWTAACAGLWFYKSLLERVASFPNLLTHFIKSNQSYLIWSVVLAAIHWNT